MVVVSVSTTLLLTGPTLRPPESTWDIAGPDAILTVVATGIVNATATVTTTPGIGIEIVTAIVPRVATTETVVTRNRKGTGVTEGAPVANLQIAGGEEATLVARLGEVPDVLVNVNVTVINPKIPGGVLQ